MKTTLFFLPFAGTMTLLLVLYFIVNHEAKKVTDPKDYMIQETNLMFLEEHTHGDGMAIWAKLKYSTNTNEP